MPLQWKNYELNEQAVDDISESIRQFLDDEGIERRNAVRIRLTMEEMMLRIIDAKGNAFPVGFGMGKQFGKHVVCLKYEGEAFDPTSGDDENWNERILVSLGLSPDWRYRKNTNTVSLRISGASGQSALFYIFAAVLAALLFGFAGRVLDPAVRADIDSILLAPLMGGFLGLLNTFAGIMIAFTICSGVLGVGDSASLGKIGKGLVLRLFLISLSIAAFSLTFASLFMDLLFSAASVSGGSELDEISKMIFGILPSDPVSPFLNCNTMQIIVISLFAGIALLTMDEHGSTLRRLVEECTTVTQMLTSSVCKLIPGFVFIALLRQIWSGAAAKLLTLWKPLALIAASVLIITAFLLLFTAMKTRKSPVFLLKCLMPPFLVAFTTASSMSAFSVSMETCEKKLGVKRSFLEFALPVGSVIFKPASLCMLCVLSCSMADIFDLQVSISWFIMAWLAATLLSIAVPPIPGAALTIYSILFAQLSIPTEALLLAAAMDVVTDFWDTGFNVLLLNIEIFREGYEIMNEPGRNIFRRIVDWFKF